MISTSNNIMQQSLNSKKDTFLRSNLVMHPYARSFSILFCVCTVKSYLFTNSISKIWYFCFHQDTMQLFFSIFLTWRKTNFQHCDIEKLKFLSWFIFNMWLFLFRKTKIYKTERQRETEKYQHKIWITQI